MMGNVSDLVAPKELQPRGTGSNRRFLTWNGESEYI